MMKIITKKIEYQSEKQFEFADITDKIEKIIQESKIKEGQVLIYSQHTTLGIRINERERGFFHDFAKTIEKLIPKSEYYEHNDLTIRTENLVCDPGASDCINGHSHCQHMLLSTSETVPISEGKIMLGTWQRIFAVELDCRRKRKILVQVIGNL
jgi:secondary thiamine-phosphate synthase enzyme